MFSMCKELSTVAPFIIVTIFFPWENHHHDLTLTHVGHQIKLNEKKDDHGDAFGFSLLAPS